MKPAPFTRRFTVCGLLTAALLLGGGRQAIDAGMTASGPCGTAGDCCGGEAPCRGSACCRPPGPQYPLPVDASPRAGERAHDGKLGGHAMFATIEPVARFVLSLYSPAAPASGSPSLVTRCVRLQV